jgi:hypothetical protein
MPLCLEVRVKSHCRLEASDSPYCGWHLVWFARAQGREGHCNMPLDQIANQNWLETNPISPRTFLGNKEPVTMFSIQIPNPTP